MGFTIDLLTFRGCWDVDVINRPLLLALRPLRSGCAIVIQIQVSSGRDAAIALVRGVRRCLPYTSGAVREAQIGCTLQKYACS